MLLNMQKLMKIVFSNMRVSGLPTDRHQTIKNKFLTDENE